MSTLDQDIINWLHTRQDWLQHAAEIYLTNGEVTDADIATLAGELKTPQGQAVTQTRTFPGLASTAQPGSELRLVSIGPVNGIEGLGTTEPLSFGTGRLCIIYGHNGSGKSSYVKVLKRMLGKPSAEQLRPNVFQTRPVESYCELNYSTDGVSRGIRWSASDAPVTDLTSVDVFDSAAADLYMAQSSTASYTPPVVLLLQNLAKVCDQAKAVLASQQSLLVSRLPQMPGELRSTKAGSAFHSLTDKTNSALLTRWTDEDELRVKQLNESLQRADPAGQAKLQRTTRTQLVQIVADLRNRSLVLSMNALTELRALRAQASEHRQAATETAEALSTGCLDGVGGETWRRLWEAARAYSSKAYPSAEYPVTKDARCVLCQQELSEAAQQRLLRFESFVQGEMERVAKGSEDHYAEVLAGLPRDVTTTELETKCQAAGLVESDWLPAFESFYRCVRSAVTALREHERNSQAVAVDGPSELLGLLEARLSELDQVLARLDVEAGGFDRVQAEREMLEMRACKWVHGERAAVDVELERLKQITLFESWKKFTSSKKISEKAGEVAERAVTGAYVARFNRELVALGASHIQVELGENGTSKGKALYRIALKNSQEVVSPRSVLSEGERRIIGLAAFLADVGGKPQVAPFVFDDPISSLDHEYEWEVARRLAELASSRQVVVLTHRLSLYSGVESAAEEFSPELKKTLQKRCIVSFEGVAGIPVGEQVWNAAKTKKANELLLKRLDEAKKAGQTGGPEAYRNSAQAVCIEFRKLIERTIEDDLLHEVVRRYDRTIRTKGRLLKLTRINEADCRLLDELMTKYSYFAHSQPRESPALIPAESVLRADIESLLAWRNGFEGRVTGGTP